MKHAITTVLLLSLATLLVSPSVQADIDAVPNPNTGTATKHGRRGGPEVRIRSHAEKNPNTIRGVCGFEESPTNPLPGPCVSILLIVNDASGKEVLKVRTSSKGDFEFSAESKLQYRIASGSRFYDVIAPTDPVHAGQRLTVKLRQK